MTVTDVGVRIDNRFWAKVYPDPDTGCWAWIASTNSRGYGIVSVDSVRYLAHRLAWEHFLGPIPDGMTIDHLCGRKPCVNPEHMEIVTRATNSSRGRPRQPLRTDLSESRFELPVVPREVRVNGLCRWGHDVTAPGATYKSKRDGTDLCCECRRVRQREFYARARRGGAR